jgi:glycosyltransferase involved in cell wall biosynthesis
MMRIAFVLNNLAGGGAERIAVTVANTLAEMGHDLSLILNHRKGPYLVDVSSKVRIIVLGKRMLRAIPSLLGLLRREKFDAILAVLDQPSIACLLIKPFIRNTRVIVIECNNPLASDSGISNSVWWAIRRLRPLLYPKADHIITKSSSIRAALIAHFYCKPARITTIENPVDTQKISALSLKPVDHEWLVEMRVVPVIVAMGRLSIQKGFDVLLQSFAALRKDMLVRLVILGEGSERQNLETLITRLGVSDDVELPGFVKNPYAYIARADCFVMSSRWEGWPNALVEALACGTPVVSSNCDSGPSEILEQGKYGMLVPVDDVAALTNAMQARLSSVCNANQLRMRVNDFSPEIIAKRYLSVIEFGPTS